MTQKRRRGGRFSFFAKLFIRNDTPYPAALDGRITPWIAISKNNKKIALGNIAGKQKQKIMSGRTAAKILDRKPVTRKQPGLPRLDMQLKKARLLLILKSGKPPREKTKTITNGNGTAQGRQDIALQARPKILK